MDEAKTGTALKANQPIAIVAIVVVIAIIVGVVFLYNNQQPQQPITSPPVVTPPVVTPPVQTVPTDYSSPQYVDQVFELEMTGLPSLNPIEDQTTLTEAAK